MTETEWLASNDPQSMVEFVTGDGSLPGDGPNRRVIASDRKLRLFACACCRQVWDMMTDERSRTAVEVAERYADGLATREDLEFAEETAHGAWIAGNPAGAARYCCLRNMAHAVRRTAMLWMRDMPSPAVQAVILRDVVGNPFRPHVVAQPKDARALRGYQILDLASLTPTVLALAEAAYGERADDGTLDPDLLAVLGDALEEAGCDDEALLRHLRGLGPHVRGCWALDPILGNER